MTPSFTNRSSLCRVGLVMLLALPLYGCGLGDYETKMLDAQKRAQRQEEESKNLDDPLVIPKKKEKVNDKEEEKELANAFFRPPRGIGSSFGQNPINGVIYRYMARQGSSTPAPGTSAPRPISEVLAVGLAFGKDQPDITDNVIRCFQPTAQPVKSRREVRHPDSPTAALYELLEFDDAQYSYSVFVSQGGRTQVAVVFWIVKGRRANVSTPLMMSMESLAIGDDANYARAVFARPSRGPANVKR